MSDIEDFLSKSEEEEIIEAIRVAELDTSGEIRVHIERTSPIDSFERAMEIFHFLKMDNTKEDNAVLIYVAVDDRNFVIYGDKGINNKVETNFWDSTRDAMLKHFKKGNFKDGLIAGISMAGKQLKKHFPYREDDTNELSNEITFGSDL